MVSRNIWQGNTYYNFCYSANMLNIKSHVDFTVDNTVLLAIIKFSKEMANAFARIQIQIKNPVKYLRWSFFPKLLALVENSKSCQTSEMKVFAKIVKN